MVAFFLLHHKNGKFLLLQIFNFKPIKVNLNSFLATQLSRFLCRLRQLCRVFRSLKLIASVKSLNEFQRLSRYLVAGIRP